jgi:hypothetical protein
MNALLIVKAKLESACGGDATSVYRLSARFAVGLYC